MKNKLGIIIKSCCFALLFFVLSKASLQGVAYPFAYGMLFALAWANQKVWLVGATYLFGSSLASFSLEGFVASLITVLFLIIPYYLHVFCKKTMKKWEIFLFSALSQCGFLLFALLNGLSAFAIVAHFAIGLFAMFLEIVIFEALFVRGFKHRLTTLEIIAGAFILMIFSCGLEQCNIYEFSFVKLFASGVILTLAHCASFGVTLGFASVIGLGAMLNANNPQFFAPFLLLALSSCAFKQQNKVFSVVAVVFTELLCTYYFSLYYSVSFISISPVLLSAVMFVCVPEKVYKEVGVLLNKNYDRMAVKNLLNRNREIMERRLDRLGEVFYDMNIVFKDLIKKQAGPEEVKEMLYEEIKGAICKGCGDHKHCHRTFNEDTKKIFIDLITIALERGKITLLDLPSYLASRCRRAKTIIEEINTLTKQYKSYTSLVGNIDTSKLLVADQLEGIAGIMKTLAGEVDTMISVDAGKEEKLIEELATNNIICMDAIVYQKDAWTTMACLVVREEDADKLKLPTVVSKICRSKMCVYEVRPSEKAGLVCVNLKTAPRSDCVFGLASMAKTGKSISGDRHTIERLDGDRFVFGICDGMGSGEKAGDKAERTIGLIENFYKAGFDNEIILSSVNRLLNLERDEMFSTIDVCVVDLKNGIADFVKMGSATSYIRGEDGCAMVECESLPVGLLDNVKALTKKVVLKNKDFIVICSDGVNDAFGSDGEFKDFLLSLRSQNPQEQADEILEKVRAINGGHAVDDMTVIVVKIFS